MSTTLALTNDSNSQDIYFVEGQLAFVTGKDYVAQRVRTRLQLFLGEWFLDTSQGVPWFQEILVKPANIVTTQALIKNTILNTPDVTGIESYSDSFDGTSRTYTVTAVINSVYGQVQISQNFSFAGGQKRG